MQALRDNADKLKLTASESLLDELLPAGDLQKVHGDALIEASEIIQASFDKGKFEPEIASHCREADGSFTDTHLAIAEIAPTGIITFNYDQGHERAAEAQGSISRSIRYDEPEELKGLLARESPGVPFILKAHGCISHPSSLVLTSSSYRAVLSNNRAYRLFLQHCFARYTILIVGFALRDRDFDQLLSVLEIELGRPIQTHAFIAQQPDVATSDGLVQRANWAALKARFGLNSVYVKDYSAIPQFLRSLGKDPGTLIDKLVTQCASPDGHVRVAAHDQANRLGRIGRSQLRSALLDRLNHTNQDLSTRSELIYSFRGIVEDDKMVRSQLLTELQQAASNGKGLDAEAYAECAAHALVVIRGLRINGRVELDQTIAALKDQVLLSQLQSLDSLCDIPRLQSYALAAAAELEARHTSL
ncbi:MAG: SIR2 family protein [Pirellula sp.]